MGFAQHPRLHTYKSPSLNNNYFKFGISNSVYQFKLNNFNKRAALNWPPRLPSRIAAVHNNSNGRRNNWAFVHASAETPSPLDPLVAALALFLQSMKGSLMQQGQTTVKKWVTRLQGCRDMFREAELGNDMFSQKGGIGLALLSTTSMAKQRISPVLGTLRANPTFMSGLLAWVLAQVLKVVTVFVVERRWDLKMLLSSGGLPSSHSALCVGLTTSVALCHGVSDALFPVCLGFSLIVMYDAIGVRRHAGMHAEVLNLIVEDLFKGHPISEKKLKELLGHTPLQVFAGACLGVFVGYVCSRSCSVSV